MVGTTLTYDLRNDAKNPTKGLWFQVGGDFAGLGGDVQYVSLAGEVRGYYPITDNITFVARGIGGIIHGWGGEDVRLIDLFFKGGETVRGFDRAGYGPRDLNTDDALGGSIYWATTAEIRFPIPFVPDDLGISGAVFADAGSLWMRAAARRPALQGCSRGNTAVVPCRQLDDPRLGRRQLDVGLAGRPDPYGLRAGPRARKPTTKSSSSASVRRRSSNRRPFGAKKASVCVAERRLSVGPAIVGASPQWRPLANFAIGTLEAAGYGMEHPGFFVRAGPFTLADVAKATGAELVPGSAPADTLIEDVRTLDRRGPARSHLLQ